MPQGIQGENKERAMTQRKTTNSSKATEQEPRVEPQAETVETVEAQEAPLEDKVTEESAPEGDTTAEVDDSADETDGEAPQEQDEPSIEDAGADHTPVAPQDAPQTARGPSMIALVIGLFGAGVAGGLVAQYANSSWPFDGSIFPARTAQVEYVTADALADLEARIDGLAPRDGVAMAQDVQSLSATVDALSAQIVDLETRLSQTAGPNAQELVQMQAEFERLSAALGSVQEIVQTQEQLRQERALATQTSQARVALAQALDAGAPFSDILSRLEGYGVDIPEALRAAAVSGAPTLGTLLAEFPEVARAALAADRGEGAAEAATPQGLGQFFKKQLGLRSVTPKEGTSTDAVLSRVEGALRAGDLTKAAQEASGLSAQAAEVSAPWLEKLNARLAIDAAFDALNAPAAQ